MQNSIHSLEAEKLWILNEKVDFQHLSGITLKVNFTGNIASISKIRALLQSLHAIEFEAPSPSIVEHSLQNWFEEFFSQPLSESKREAWLKDWRVASSEKKFIMEEALGWTAEDWLYWMDPINRAAYLVDVEKSEESVWVFTWITVEGNQLNKATIWALKCCGLS